MNQQVIDELYERIARLEAARTRGRRVYNQQEAARELGMSVNKFRSEQNAGRISGKRSGKKWMFTDTDLEAYLAALAA
jgi:hypothetical protein